jgi:hypothetical protein
MFTLQDKTFNSESPYLDLISFFISSAIISSKIALISSGLKSKLKISPLKFHLNYYNNFNR